MSEEKNTSIFGSSEDERKKYEAEQLANLFEEAPQVPEEIKPEVSQSTQEPSSQIAPSEQIGETSPLSDQLPKESETVHAERKVMEGPPKKHAEELAEKVTPQQMLQKAQEQQHAGVESQMEQLGKHGATGSQVEKATEQARQVQAGGRPRAEKQKMETHNTGKQNVRARETTSRMKGKKSKTTVAQKAVSEAKKGVMRTVIEDVVLPNQVPILGPGIWWGWKALKKLKKII
jgi:hypothetical protein